MLLYGIQEIKLFIAKLLFGLRASFQPASINAPLIVLTKPITDARI
jgi:hypothetical protein